MDNNMDQKIYVVGSEIKNDIVEEFSRVFRGLHRNFWYALRISVLIVISFFECEKCGRCCMYSPPVFRRDEAERIAGFLGKSVDELPLTMFVQFFDVYYRAPKPCPFLDKENKKCRVYEVRGASCRSFPHEWLMYAMIPTYCPAVFKAIKKATKFIKENKEKIQVAIEIMENDLKRLAGDSKFKDRMRYMEYGPLVKKLMQVLNS